MPVIYADILVALNWLIDFLLLAAAGCLLHIPPRRWRLIVSSFIGGIYALVVLLPPWPATIRVLADVVVAAVMALIAFPLARWTLVLKRIFVLFAVSTAFFGAATLLSSLFIGEYVLVNNGRLYAAVSPLMLTAFTVVSYLLVRLFDYVTARRMPQNGKYRLTVKDDGELYIARALCDTGLHLREPFSGAPVIVAERNRLLPCLADDMKRALEQTSAHPRVRMIPYKTVGGEGLLPAFRPRSVSVKRLGEKERDITGVYVALCEDLGRGEYTALIGTDCCQGGYER